MERLSQASSRVREIPLQWELDRLEREVKFSPDPEIRREATRRYIELTDRDYGQ